MFNFSKHKKEEGKSFIACLQEAIDANSGTDKLPMQFGKTRARANNAMNVFLTFIGALERAFNAPLREAVKGQLDANGKQIKAEGLIDQYTAIKGWTNDSGEGFSLVSAYKDEISAGNRLAAIVGYTGQPQLEETREALSILAREYMLRDTDNKSNTQHILESLSAPVMPVVKKENSLAAVIG